MVHQVWSGIVLRAVTEDLKDTNAEAMPRHLCLRSTLDTVGGVGLRKDRKRDGADQHQVDPDAEVDGGDGGYKQHAESDDQHGKTTEPDEFNPKEGRGDQGNG